MEYKIRERIVELGLVERYHRTPAVVRQNIAAHSWGVAWLITEFHPSPSVALIKAALEHDIEEVLTSDVGYDSKQEFPYLKGAMEQASHDARVKMGIPPDSLFSEEDIWWLKWADLLEGCLWSRHLYENHGDKRFLGIWNRYSAAVELHLTKAPEGFDSMARHYSNAATRNLGT